MTPREFSGWVPAERHEHYDPDGNLTGYTIVERESRIDDGDRAELLGLARYEAELCMCGYHPSLTDPDAGNVFTPESRTCHVCGGMAVWQRIEHEQQAKTPHDAPPRTPRHLDGRHSYMRMLTPQEAEAAQASRGSAPETSPRSV